MTFNLNDEIESTLRNEILNGEVDIISKEQVGEIFDKIMIKYNIGIGAINWLDENLMFRVRDSKDIKQNNYDLTKFISDWLIKLFGNEDIIISIVFVSEIDIGYRMNKNIFLNNLDLFIPIPANLIILLPNGKLLNYTTLDELYYG